MPVGGAGAEQRAGIGVQARLGLGAVQAIGGGPVLLARKPAGQPQQRIAHVPFRASERGQAEGGELELQPPDIEAAQSQVVGEVDRARPVLGMRGIDPGTLALAGRFTGTLDGQDGRPQ